MHRYLENPVSFVWRISPETIAETLGRRDPAVYVLQHVPINEIVSAWPGPRQRFGPGFNGAVYDATCRHPSHGKGGHRAYVARICEDMRQDKALPPALGVHYVNYDMHVATDGNHRIAAASALGITLVSMLVRESDLVFAS